MTEWKSLEFIGYPMYMVSSEGKVKSVKTGKLIKPCINHKGYYHVRLCKDGKYKTFRVHRLVAMAFIPNPNNLPEVNHKNENKHDNTLSNLEWCDMRYNIEYSNLNSPVYKYSTEGELLCRYWSISEAARCNGISKQGLRQYLNGKRVTVAYYGFIYRYEKQSPFELIRNDEAIERKREADRLYKLLNKECIKEKRQEYRQKNKERIKEYKHNYRLRKKLEQAQEKP